MPIYIEHLINELLRAHGGKLISAMEPEIRAIVQAAIDQERERAAKIARDRAAEWDKQHDHKALLPSGSDRAYHRANEAVDIARLILDS